MSAGKIIGGIIGIFAGWMILMNALMLQIVSWSGGYSYMSAWIWNMAIGALAIVGSILAFASKKASGGLLLAAGLVSIVLGLLSNLAGMIEATQYSYFALWGIMDPVNNLFLGVSLEAILILLGGVICLASSSD